MEKRDFVSTLADVDDITQLPDYNPAGQRQAFDHGRVNKYRPDLNGPEWDQFDKDHVLYNNPLYLSKDGGGIDDQGMLDSMLSVINGGGQISSLADRARRGVVINGSSVSSDFSTGGGSYVFTRIKKKSKMKNQPGIYWKAKEIKRMDAITYGSDNFGKVNDNNVDISRQTTIEQFTRNGSAGSDETIFKNGLSYFDNIERFVFPSQAGRDKAIKELTALGYEIWPDGRNIKDVIFYAGQSR